MLLAVLGGDAAQKCIAYCMQTKPALMTVETKLVHYQLAFISVFLYSLAHAFVTVYLLQRIS